MSGYGDVLFEKEYKEVHKELRISCIACISFAIFEFVFSIWTKEDGFLFFSFVFVLGSILFFWLWFATQIPPIKIYKTGLVRKISLLNRIGMQYQDGFFPKEEIKAVRVSSNIPKEYDIGYDLVLRNKEVITIPLEPEDVETFKRALSDLMDAKNI